MTDAPQSDPSHVPDPTHEDSYGAALGRLASGLFIVTTRDERGQPMGFLGSFVQQVSLDPPTVMVAVAKGREHLDAIRAAGRFGVSVLGDEDKGLMKPFFKKPEEIWFEGITQALMSYILFWTLFYDIVHIY